MSSAFGFLLGAEKAIINHQFNWWLARRTLVYSMNLLC